MFANQTERGPKVPGDQSELWKSQWTSCTFWWFQHLQIGQKSNLTWRKSMDSDVSWSSGFWVCNPAGDVSWEILPGLCRGELGRPWNQRSCLGLTIWLDYLGPKKIVINHSKRLWTRILLSIPSGQCQCLTLEPRWFSQWKLSFLCRWSATKNLGIMWTMKGYNA